MKNIAVLLMLTIGMISAESDILYFQFYSYSVNDNILYKSNHFKVNICAYVDCRENYGIDRYNRFSVKIQKIFDEEVAYTKAWTYRHGGVRWAKSKVDLDHKIFERTEQYLSKNGLRHDSLHIESEVLAKFRKWESEIKNKQKKKLEDEKERLAEIKARKEQRENKKRDGKIKNANRAYQMKSEQNQYLYNNCMNSCANYKYHECLEKCKREYQQRDAQALRESYPSSSTKKYSEPEWSWTAFLAVVVIVGATVGLSTLFGAGF